MREISAIGSEFSAKFGNIFPLIALDVNTVSDDNPFGIGAKRSFVPHLGEIEWDLSKDHLTHAPFSAYIYKLSNGRKVGYVRIPHYNFEETAIKEFSEIISLFENETSAMVLDQVNNPGGSMFLMYDILTMLTDRPLDLPKHRIAIFDELVVIAKKIVEFAETGNAILSDDFDNPPSSEMVDYSRFILSEIEAGRHLTNPIHLCGIKNIQPAKIHYTKKIIVLINELTFSAPEFLAAILQDNKRATLFGIRTAGAGGCVKKCFTPLSKEPGIEYFTLTWTMAWRSNGQPIENIGVHPDIEYSITVEDLQFDFIGYRDELIKSINSEVDSRNQ